MACLGCRGHSINRVPDKCLREGQIQPPVRSEGRSPRWGMGRALDGSQPSAASPGAGPCWCPGRPFHLDSDQQTLGSPLNPLADHVHGLTPAAYLALSRTMTVWGPHFPLHLGWLRPSASLTT